MNKEKIIKKLKNDEVIAFPTDTVFGLIAKIKKQNISKINNLKKRKSETPLQILFSSVEEASNFFENDFFVMEYLEQNYKNKTSYIVKSKKDFANQYLTESFKGTFMFRIPEGEILNLIKEVGPLFATSANLHGQEPISDNNLISSTFGIYVSDIEQKSHKASDIISLINKEVRKIR